MAPTTLASNSFLLIHPKLNQARSPRLAVNAKKSAPQAEDSPSSPSSGGFPQFKFDFGKLSDVKSVVPVVSQPSGGLSFRRKDPRTVFVAGATGQAGIRIALSLLREGFSVRAGVPELGTAQELARLAATYKIISNDEFRRLNAVESAFQDVESIAKAIGNSSKIVVTIGPTEFGPSAEVTPSNALLVVQAAKLAGVGHVVVVCDRNPSLATSTYNILDGISSFFGNLFSRSQPISLSEVIQGLVAADVSYTVIKASLADDYAPESSYNVVVSAEGSSGSSLGDYKVAKSRIASLVAGVVSNTAVAQNKVVKVSVDPSAPSRPIDELFGSIPEDSRRKEYAESIAKAKSEEEALLVAEKAGGVAKKLKEEAQKLAEQEAKAGNLAEQAKERAEAARISVEGIFGKAKGIGAGFSLDKLNFNLGNGTREPEEKPKVQIATLRGRAKAKALPAKKAVVKRPSPPARKAVKEEVDKKEVRKVFGGLFQQETIYIDDD